MRYRSIVCIGIALAIFGVYTRQAHAGFTPGYVISNSDFTDTTPTATSVQTFLERRTGVLASTIVTDENGAQVRFSDALTTISQMFQVSAKVLLVTLQKEQSLVNDPTPSQNQLDCAMGYEWGNGCTWMYVNKPALRGLYNQVYAAAWQFRQYLNTNSPKKAGVSYLIDGTQVLMQNAATAALYSYTPHLHGNESFYNLYSAWFSRIFPDGTLLRIGKNGGVWLIQDGQRRAFQNRAAFITRFGNFSKVIETTSDAVEAYPRGPNISLPNYSLVRTPDGAIYLLSGDEKRLISSPEVFRNLGFNPEEVEDIALSDLAGYLDGVSITNADAYPAGALVRVKENGGITWIEQGVWHPIYDKSIIQSRLPGRRATVTITLSELAQYQKGDPLLLRDGELIRVKNDPGVYVISDGQRRAVTSRALFNKLGYKMKNVLVVSQRVADIHPLGEPLSTVVE